MAFEASARDRGSIEGFEAVLWTGFGVFSSSQCSAGKRKKEEEKGVDFDQPDIIAQRTPRAEAVSKERQNSSTSQSTWGSLAARQI